MTIPDRGHLDTEALPPGADRLDAATPEEICRAINAADAAVARAVAAVADDVAKLVAIAEAKLRAGGRLIYVGAGTSGRLGVLDASECPPTFRSAPGQVIGVIAGGRDALVRSSEGLEDQPALGAAAIVEHNVGPSDLVVGIAAGGTTPFVHAALAEARTRGAATGFVACVPAGQAPSEADVEVRPLTGPEVVAGSTRMKAGSATKMVLNMLTTATFIRLGKTYGPCMVDLRATNAKLTDRAARLIMRLCDLDRPAALALLARADNQVKPAVVMHHRQCGLAEAMRLLDDAQGRLRAVIGDVG